MKRPFHLANLLLAGLAGLASSAHLAPGQERVAVPPTVLVRSCDASSPTLAYAVERVVAELHNVYGLKAIADAAAADPFAPPPEGAGVVLLGQLGKSEALTVWCRDHGLTSSRAPLSPEGYHIITRAKPRCVVIAGESDVGAWYGACAWLDSLRDTDGGVAMPLGVVQDAPALAIRFSRGLGSVAHASRSQETITSLDWWARWRMNVAHAEGLSGPALQAYLAEAHKRGIRVVHGVGVRSLCAADDAAVAKRAEEVRSFLQLGGDGISLLWDDLPHDRCRGHCDRCRERFGTNSLPHEIVHILEAFCAAAAQVPGHPLLLWCPPHYSEARYPELSDEAFFRVIGSSAAVRKQTQMYFCEFAPEKTALLDRMGITNRVWWYNGLRTVYHVSYNWPSQPEMKLSIPGVKAFGAPDFARFEVGWKTGIGVRGDGTVVPIGAEAWHNLRTLPERYDGYYPCTAGHPYHAALSGLFGFSPAKFDQAEADRVIFRAIFGPDSAVAARAWSDAYVEFQVWLAQSAKHPATSTHAAEAQRRLERWRGYSREVQACAVREHGLLAPAFVKSVLARMTDAEDSVERMVKDGTKSREKPQPTAARDEATTSALGAGQ